MDYRDVAHHLKLLGGGGGGGLPPPPPSYAYALCVLWDRNSQYEFCFYGFMHVQTKLRKGQAMVW